MHIVSSKLILSSADVEFRTSAGERLILISARYNATISALELRTVRNAGDPPWLAEAIGQSPLHIAERGMPRCLLHFEIATLAFPFEFGPLNRDDAGAVQEVVVLRGLRMEMVSA